MNEIIIDGKNATLGRLGSYSAKQALLGKKVIIVNASEVLIIGKKSDIISKYKEVIKKGGSSQKGPKIIRIPERILKRTIRGMLPHKEKRGKEALKRILCYNGVPEKYREVKKLKGEKEKMGKFITLNELAKMIK
ncbi:MAG: 50S ribosomal protein L13 [Candidatus Pacearchaeota archaeon]